MKTIAQKLEGATKKIKEQQRHIRAEKYRANTYAKAAASDNARVQSAEMFINYLINKYCDNGELIIPLDELYACTNKVALFQPIPDTNSIRVALADK